jgi:hypothetical protein
MVASPCRASIRIAGSDNGRGRRRAFDPHNAEGRMANCGLQPSLRQSFHLHPLPPPRPSLPGSVPGRLRRDAQATHLLDLLQARVVLCLPQTPADQRSAKDFVAPFLTALKLANLPPSAIRRQPMKTLTCVKRTSLVASHMSDFGCKADMAFCGISLSR